MPTQQTVAIASDHAGFGLKSELVAILNEHGHTVIDLGTGNGTDSVDYPDFGRAVAQAVTSGDAAFGVVVCGSGIGISIAANRVPGCRAALCHDVTTARLSRQHNDANVLALGARVIGPAVALECLEAFLETGFEGGRHQRRLDKL